MTREETGRADDRDDALAELIRAAGRRPAPTAVEYERVRLASHLAWQMKVSSRKRRRVLWFALAASLVLVVAASLLLPGQVTVTAPSGVAQISVLRGRVEQRSEDDAGWSPLSVGATVAAGVRLRTGQDGGVALALRNDVVVRVAAGTTWSVDDVSRLTLELGALYVDTGQRVPGAGGVEIATSRGAVRDIGTQFEVRADDARVRLRVREGRVVLRPIAGQALYEAPAGEELLVAADGGLERRALAPDSAEWQWIEALAVPIDLEGTSAFDALRWIARETGKTLVFEDANAELLARNAILHGSSTGLAPLQMLEVVIATSIGLAYQFGDGTLVIRRR
jgi:hypothetical protein